MARWAPIRDGYTRKGFIEGVPNLYAELRFDFRPVTTEEGSDFYERVGRLKSSDQDRETAKLIAGKVVRWSGEDVREPGRPDEAVTAKLALQLNRRQMHRLGNVILGQEPSDTDPRWSAEEATQPDDGADQKN